MNFKQFGLLVGLSLLNHQAWSSCELVAQLAGKDYVTSPQYAASMQYLAELNPLTQVGVWQVYAYPKNASNQSETFQTCALIQLDGVEFFPVLQMQNRFAVINGLFMIKTHHEADIHRMAQRYGFKLISGLPNRFTAVFDVNAQVDSTQDYDEILRKLDRDKDIQVVVPVLIEADTR